MTSSMLPPMPDTGWAAPMLVPGAIAATSATTVMRKPAEAARAPEGPTKTATGTRELSIASMICRIDVSSPPGVSSLSTTRGALEAAARSSADTTCAALTACTTPVSSMTGMSARAGTATKEAARVSAPRRLWIPTDTRKCNGPNSFLSMEAATGLAADGRGDVESGSCLEHSADPRSS